MTRFSESRRGLTYCDVDKSQMILVALFWCAKRERASTPPPCGGAISAIRNEKSNQSSVLSCEAESRSLLFRILVVDDDSDLSTSASPIISRILLSFSKQPLHIISPLPLLKGTTTPYDKYHTLLLTSYYHTCCFGDETPRETRGSSFLDGQK